jgi:hypothetical protein
MKYNFKTESRKIHRREVQSLHKQLLENNEPYYKQVADEGYDNLHDYETHVTTEMMKRILIVLTIVFVFIVGSLLLWHRFNAL